MCMKTYYFTDGAFLFDITSSGTLLRFIFLFFLFFCNVQNCIFKSFCVRKIQYKEMHTWEIDESEMKSKVLFITVVNQLSDSELKDGF